MDAPRRSIEADSGFGSGKAGWERLDWGCVVADELEGRRATAANRAQHPEETADMRPANEDAGCAAGTVEDTP